MLTIILHTSKTTRTVLLDSVQKSGIADNNEAHILMDYLKSLDIKQIGSAMQITESLASKTYELIHNPDLPTLPALDLFLGDIYSGLQAQSFTQEDRQFANDHLFILSGLYGVLRALDEIQPYRLEMGYKLPGNAHVKNNLLDKDGNPTIPNITSLYDFWGDKIAKQLPKNQDIINLSAVEYTKAVLPYIQGTKTIKPIEGHENTKVITPKFLTISPKTKEPTFVTVHAKIARGAFARWLIQHRIEDLSKLKDFQEIGYQYNEALSTQSEPVFVAKEFQGRGLSVRRSK